VGDIAVVRRERLTASARALRQRATSAEDVLWEALRHRQLGGLKFRRQCPAGPFVLDFSCPERRIAVELDGSVHDEQQAQDAARTAILEGYGYRVIRFRNEDVFADLSISYRVFYPLLPSSSQVERVIIACSLGLLSPPLLGWGEGWRAAAMPR